MREEKEVFFAVQVNEETIVKLLIDNSAVFDLQDANAKEFLDRFLLGTNSHIQELFQRSISVSIKCNNYKYGGASVDTFTMLNKAIPQHCFIFKECLVSHNKEKHINDWFCSV